MTDEMAAVERMHGVLLKCFEKHDLSEYCGAVAMEMKEVFAYDQATIMFLDVSGKIQGNLLYGIRQNVWKRFLHYFNSGLNPFSIDLTSAYHPQEKDKVMIRDWTDANTRAAYDNFYRLHVEPMGLTYCLGFLFCDERNCARCIFSFDRFGEENFTADDVKAVRHLLPLLESKFIDLLLPAQKVFAPERLAPSELPLTDREAEVAELICGGCDSARIAARLSISPTTVYKHLSNIYRKLNISNRQELFAVYSKLFPNAK